MGARSRKRGRTDRAPVVPEPAPAPAPAPVEPMETAVPAEPVAAATEPEEGGRRLRGEARNEAIRAGMTPLAPGERPFALLVAMVFSVGVAILNVALDVFDVQDGNPGQNYVFAAIMVVAAVGMWYQRYWAVLGFQALLGITVLLAGLSIPFASNLEALALCLAIVSFGGWLFWKLVRVLGRMKAPERPGAA